MSNDERKALNSECRELLQKHADKVSIEKGGSKNVKGELGTTLKDLQAFARKNKLSGWYGLTRAQLAELKDAFVKGDAQYVERLSALGKAQHGGKAR